MSLPRGHTGKRPGGIGRFLALGLAFACAGLSADTVPLFRIDNPDVLGLMNMQQTNDRYYSFAALRPFIAEIERLSAQANELKPEQRSSFQTAVVNLANRLFLYHKLQNTFQVMGMHDVALIYQQSHDRLRQASREHKNNPGATTP